MKKWFVLLGLLVIVTVAVSACGGDDKDAKPTSYTIGLLNTAAPGTLIINGFKEGMTELGYVEGQNVTYVLEFPEDPAQVNAAAQRLVDAEVDLIFGVGRTEALAARAATDTVPIVFGVAYDPVLEGLVESLALPGGNVTGMVIPSVQPKRLELLVEIDPTIHRVYIPYNPGDPVDTNIFGTVEEFGSTIGIEIIPAEISDLDTARQAISTMPTDVDAIFLGPSRFVLALAPEWIAESVSRQIPLSWMLATLPDPNVLMGYGPDLFESGKQAASQVDRVLKGADPGELPVIALNVYFSLSLQAAETLAIEVSDVTLARADNIIYPDTEGDQ